MAIGSLPIMLIAFDKLLEMWRRKMAVFPPGSGGAKGPQTWMGKLVSQLTPDERQWWMQSMRQLPLRTVVDMAKGFNPYGSANPLDDDMLDDDHPKSSLDARLDNEARALLLQRIAGLGSRFVVNRPDFLHCHVHRETDKVIVFWVSAGQGGYVEQAIAEFPSDTFVAQIRLIFIA